MKDDLSNNIIIDYKDKSIRQFVKDPYKKCLYDQTMI